jgi:hypothetical protein
MRGSVSPECERRARSAGNCSSPCSHWTAARSSSVKGSVEVGAQLLGGGAGGGRQHPDNNPSAGRKLGQVRRHEVPQLAADSVAYNGSTDRATDHESGARRQVGEVGQVTRVTGLNRLSREKVNDEAGPYGTATQPRSGGEVRTLPQS